MKAVGFFVGSALSRPTVFSPVLAQRRDHSLPRHRVNGTVANMKEEFAKAFSCPSTAPMVRGDKACRAW
jgi:predicted metalloendopeptidase